MNIYFVLLGPPTQTFDMNMCPVGCTTNCQGTCPVACCSPPPPPPPPPQIVHIIPPPPPPPPSPPPPPPPPTIQYIQPPPPPPPPPPCAPSCYASCAPSCSPSCCGRSSIPGVATAGAAMEAAPQTGSTAAVVTHSKLSVEDMCPPVCSTDCLPFCPDMCCNPKSKAEKSAVVPLSPPSVKLQQQFATSQSMLAQEMAQQQATQRQVALQSAAIAAQRPVVTASYTVPVYPPPGQQYGTVYEKSTLPRSVLASNKNMNDHTQCKRSCSALCSADCPIACCEVTRKRSKIPRRKEHQ